jgi:hypothetical protein
LVEIKETVSDGVGRASLMPERLFDISNLQNGSCVKVFLWTRWRNPAKSRQMACVAAGMAPQREAVEAVPIS